MNETEYLLTCIAEECNEVSQRCTKALRFGLFETQPGQPYNNLERIIYEYNDLVTVLLMLLTSINANEDILDPDSVEEKARKVKNLMEYSRAQGTLKD